MNENEWLTVSEISEKTKIPAETIRRYIREHGIHLKIKKSGKEYRIHDESVNVIEKIRVLKESGKNKEEVEETLAASGIPLTITIKNEHDERMTVHVNDELQEIKKALLEQRQFNEQQKQFNLQLLQEIKNQQLYYEKKFEEEKHAREFIGSLRDSMQQRKLELTEHENKTTKQLENIEHQLSSIKEDPSVKELTEKVAELTNQLGQVQQALQETSAAREKVVNDERTMDDHELEPKKKKKGLWAWLSGE